LLSTLADTAVLDVVITQINTLSSSGKLSGNNRLRQFPGNL